MHASRSQNSGLRFLIGTASLIVVIAGLKSAASLLVPLAMAVFLALINLPLLNFLRARRLPTFIAVVSTMVTTLSVLALIVWLITGSLARFTDKVPEYRQELRATYQNSIEWLDQRGVPTQDLNRDALDPAQALDVGVQALTRAAEAVKNVGLVLLTIIFILFEAAGFPDKLQAAFGRRSSSERYEKIRLEVQRYLGMKTLVSLFTGLFVTIPLWAMQIEFALLWGLIAFLLNYIPNLGSALAAIPPVIVTLVERGAGWAIGVAVVFIVVNTIFGNFVEPYLMGRRLGMSTLVVFLSLVFWGWVWGPIGMLLSVPLTMILKIMMENTEDFRWLAVLLSGQPETPKKSPAASMSRAAVPSDFH